ncbi:bifunctional pyr operon transcriptional regulator/uracil phosphoribosyltransferase PyrR [Acidihalobacter ferrooxydans]|uniref:Bifunctional pyr operon transcriptional regulator/uracil phosphoribosyltransferase n=1 Tax=Acidihalobacter ferrooxydans TaxID=1765967 RepID=A0A1P8UDM8_9GAMM|nr:bifunctional pyr operon transcriptional regulator/uracil phosphoribosyltransferase PyrR [Acidihalobacter ferrooxydans]APZ41971.1 bifunctional pyr operon transcriptional regulator/uracil phosphoribosyltransferase [Acidihalobacter ferrooxydans]
MTETTTLPAVAPLLDALATRLHAELTAAPEAALLVGIHTGGAWLAAALHRRLDLPVPLGTLDVSYYRDDLAQGGLRPRQQPSALPGGVDGKTVWLIDDVLHTGRTVRAALNELFDFGRPARVRLLVLVDRGGHELPIRADLVGTRVDALPAQRRVRLHGPDPLHLELGDGRSMRAGDTR